MAHGPTLQFRPISGSFDDLVGDGEDAITDVYLTI